MKKEKYKLEDIDFRIVKYFDAYIKQTLKYTKIDFIKQISDKRNHDDLLKEWKHKDGETADSQNDRYIFGEVRLDNYIIGFESEILFKQIMHLTEKQREVLLKNVVLDTEQLLHYFVKGTFITIEETAVATCAVIHVSSS